MFFIRFLVRKENGYKAKVQKNQWIRRLNGKENGRINGQNLPLSLVPKSYYFLNPKSTLFSFFAPKIEE
jgi:hypothetical protein